MEGLTARQAQVLDIIRGYIDEYGMPPTRVELAETMGFRSANAAEDHLRALARKGYIELLAGSSRGIVVLDEAEETGLPLIGRVAAGEPMLAEEHVEEHYAVDADLFSPAADYLLRVRGMSMRDAGILEGDLLAVHRTHEAKNGELVVARVDNEVTVKRYQKKGSKIFLHPENPDFSVIEVDLKRDTLEIEGVGVGIIRNGITI